VSEANGVLLLSFKRLLTLAAGQQDGEAKALSDGMGHNRRPATQMIWVSAANEPAFFSGGTDYLCCALA
jgi:hypothetical protein